MIHWEWYITNLNLMTCMLNNCILICIQIITYMIAKLKRKIFEIQGVTSAL